MNVYYCDRCRAIHPVDIKKDVMYYDNPQELR
ncbi:hypothetical protein LCGC14_2020340 [marine sediment metagenome]|uniref:Uncharacterized protein n=1 Tax=marine sediment metagenome TaxID=412755 RepID=A0A0F9HB07_9ZZZZ